MAFTNCTEDSVTTEDLGDTYPLLINPTIQTRATESSFEVGDNIGVSIVMDSDESEYATNREMTYSDNLFSGDVTWYSDDDESSTLLAYYPYVSGSTAPISFSVSSDQSSAEAYTASDLMMSKLSGVTPSLASKSMTFIHSLSQVVVSVDNQSDQTIESLSFSGAYHGATIDLSSQSVTANAFSARTEIIAGLCDDGTYKAILIPQDAALEITLKFADGSQSSQTVDSKTFTAGTQLSASLTYEKEVITVEFSSEINDWDDGGGFILSSNEGADYSYNLEDPFVVSYPEENDKIKYSESFSFSRTIYVDPVDGDDNNDGLSEDSAIKTLAHLNEYGIQRGDEILLKGGVTHYGAIDLLSLGSSPTADYIRVGSYGASKARINATGEMAGIRLENTSNVYISDLKITANGGDKSNCTNYNDNSNYDGYDVGVNMRCGVNITNHSSSYTYNVTLYNLDIRDIYYYGVGETPEEYSHRPCKEWSTGNEGEYGWGIKTFVRNGFLFDLNIKECNVRNVSHTGIKMTGDGGFGDPSTDISEWSARYQGLVIDGCKVNETGAPGMMFTNLKDAIVRNCEIIRPGSRTSSLSIAEDGARKDEPRKWGRGSGMWLVRCDGLLFEHNILERSEGTADCCGAHIDIGNRDIIIQYCLSKDNAGGFVEVLGNNYNCSYRYNVSINDGWRNQNCSTQKTLWDTTYMTDGYLITINGHNSEDASLGPFYTYVYNNTIVATPDFEGGYTNALMYEYEMSAKGILMTNNIFWIPQRMDLYGWSATPSAVGVYTNVHEFRTYDGTSARDMTQDEIEALNFSVKNNLYRLFDPENITYDSYGYPDSKTMPTVTTGDNDYWDESPLGGDPGFKNYSESNFDLTAEDLIPTNSTVINRGVTIEQLDTDPTSYGLDYGLNLTEDYFGNAITTPIVGAIVAQ